LRPCRGGSTRSAPSAFRDRNACEMQDAVITAAEELGSVDFDKWGEQLKGEPGNGLKQYYKALAVKEMRTFGIILAHGSARSAKFNRARGNPVAASHLYYRSF
jgi:hypothetical protein